jgi:hypothetical protein
MINRGSLKIGYSLLAVGYSLLAYPLCASAPLRLCASAPLRLCGSAALRLCGSARGFEFISRAEPQRRRAKPDDSGLGLRHSLREISQLSSQVLRAVYQLRGISY